MQFPAHLGFRRLAQLVIATLAGLTLSALPQSSSAAESNQTVRRALLVGVTKYARPNDRNSWWDLNVEGDLLAVSNVLTTKFQFAPQNVRVLRSPAETTHAAIVQAFRDRLIAPTQPGDTVVFHFSGHGQQIPDDNGDELDGLDESLIPSDYVSQTDGTKNIRDDDLGLLLSELKKKKPANVTIILDSCFSGTATRGGRQLVRGKAWSGPLPKTNNSAASAKNDGASGLLAESEAVENGYILISAARQDQVAQETDDDRGGKMGLLSYALTRTLAEARPQSTYRDVFERLREIMSVRDPDQSPQLEGEIDKVLLEGTALPPQPYMPVDIGVSGKILVPAGTLHGLNEGSRLKLFPAGTKDFQDTVPLSEAVVKSVDLTSSELELIGFGAALKPDTLKAARAVITQRQFGDNRLRVNLSELKTTPLAERVTASLRDFPLAILETRSENWDVRVRPAKSPSRGGTDDVFLLERSNGRTLREFDANAGGDSFHSRLRAALEGEARWQFIKRLENTDPQSLVQIELQLIPVEVKLDSGGGVKPELRDKPLPNRGNALQIREGDYYQIQLRNRGAFDAFVSVLSLDSEGRIGPIWPHPDVKVQENKIRADGQWHRVPYPFVFQVTRPLGTETLKAIATREPADFSCVIDRETLQRGEENRSPAQTAAANSPLGQLLSAVTMGQRSSLGRISVSDWSSASITFEVVAK